MNIMVKNIKKKNNIQVWENQMTRVKILEEVCKLRTNPSFKILKTETWTASKKYYTMLVKLLLKARGLFNTPRPHKGGLYFIFRLD